LLAAPARRAVRADGALGIPVLACAAVRAPVDAISRAQSPGAHLGRSLERSLA